MNRTRPRRQLLVGSLLIRSRPFRGTLLASFLASVIVCAVYLSVAALRLSHEQSVEQVLGATQASIDTSLNVRAGVETPSVPTWLPRAEGVQTIESLRALVVLAEQRVAYTETALPSPAFSGNVVLQAGRWPRVSGECVATGTLTALTTPLGTWDLDVVGRVQDYYQPSQVLVLCAPGTWRAWRLPQTEAVLAPGAAIMYFLDGPPGAVSDALSGLPRESADLELTVMVRSESQTTLSSTDFVGLVFPLLLILGGSCVALSVAFGGWSYRIRQALLACGVPGRVLRSSTRTAAVAGSAIAAVLGGSLGQIASLAARPLLGSLNGGAPLSPWSFDAILLIVVGGLVPAAVLTGCLIGESRSRRKTQAADHQAGAASSRAWMIPLAVLLIAVSWGMILVADGWLWLLLPSGLVTMGGAALLFPSVADAGARFAVKRPVGAARVAGRVVIDQSRKLAVIGSVLVLVLGSWLYALALLITNSASQQAIMAARMPPGTTRILTSDLLGQAYPPRVVEEFERDVGVRNPVVISEAAFIQGDSGGVLWSFDRVEDVVRVVPGLSVEDLQLLSSGGALTTVEQGSNLSLRRVEDGRQLRLKARYVQPTPGVTVDAPGFVLASALGPAGTSAESSPVFRWNVYTGLTPTQDQLARSWPEARGYAAVQVDAHYGVDWFIVPLYTAMSLVVMGVALIGLTRAVLGDIAAGLRPTLASLHALGAPRSFGSHILRHLVSILLGSALALATAASAITIVLLYLVTPSAFSLAGGQWWLLLTYLVAVWAGGMISVRLATRRLHHTEALTLV